MDSQTLLFIGAIAVVISYAILFLIIRNASRADESIRLQQIQIRLLSKLLQEKGVTTEELEEVVNV